MVETLYGGWEVLEKPKRGLRDSGVVWIPLKTAAWKQKKVIL